MKTSTTWIIIFGIVSVSALLLSLYQLLGWVGPLLLFALAVSVAVVMVVFSKTYVHIGELEYGVVFYRNGDFARFLESGWQTINPLREKLTDRITKGSQKAHATTSFRTKDGIPVEITWSVSFKINIANIRESIQYKMARALPKSADKLVAGKAIQSLRHIVEQKSILELYRVDACKELELQLCDQVNARLQLRHKEAFSSNGVAEIPPKDPNESISGLGPEPIPWFDVQITEIRMPLRIEKALEIAHERRLQTETAAHALERLQEVVAQFTDKDMQRLEDLEKLRILEKENGSMLHVMASLAQTIRQEPPPNGS
jgi:regulator of protease activity HflC (stomatin/prohibitin superfamily)